MAPKGKWAAGIVPRNFCWVIKDRLAVCERPGGYSTNHRRVRRQEEIIWIREQGFTCVVSLLDSPHNLHNYDELGVTWVHRPYGPSEGVREAMAQLYPELREALAQGGKLILHRNQLDDALSGLVAGYLLWTGLVPTGPRAISLIEQITHRQLGPVGRQLVGLGREIPQGRTGASVAAMVPSAGNEDGDGAGDGAAPPPDGRVAARTPATDGVAADRAATDGASGGAGASDGAEAAEAAPAPAP